MLDAPAHVLLVGVGLHRRFEQVQGLAVGAVADRVDAELVPVLHGQLRGRLHGGQRRGLQPRARGQVRIGLEQPRPARAQRAVERVLDRAHGQVLVIAVHETVGGQPLRHPLVRVADHDPEAHPELPLGRDLLHDVDRLEAGARVLEAGDALGHRLLVREVELPADLGLALRRLHARAGAGVGLVEQPVRGLAEEAGRLALGVLQDVAPGRALRVAGDARQLHGLRVGEGGVAAGVLEDDRVAGRGRAQGLVSGEAFHRGLGAAVPLLLVPAAPADPLPGPRLARGLLDHGHDLVPVLHAREIQDDAGVTHAGEVAVGLDEAGHCAAALEVDHLRPDPDVGRDVFIRAHGHERIAARGQRLRLRPGIVHGGDTAVAEDQGRGLDLGLGRGHGRSRQHREHGHARRASRCLPHGFLLIRAPTIDRRG